MVRIIKLRHFVESKKEFFWQANLHVQLLFEFDRVLGLFFLYFRIKICLINHILEDKSKPYKGLERQLINICTNIFFERPWQSLSSISYISCPTLFICSVLLYLAEANKWQLKAAAAALLLGNKFGIFCTNDYQMPTISRANLLKLRT